MKAPFSQTPHKLNIIELDSSHAVTDTIRKMCRVVSENQTVSITTLFNIRASVIAQRRRNCYADFLEHENHDVNCICQNILSLSRTIQRSRAPVTNAGRVNAK